MASNANPSAGEVYTLICTATVVENLVVMPILTWIDSLNDAMPGMQEDDGITSTLTLMFNPLRTQQGGVYTCQAVITIVLISLERSADGSQSVIVQSKSLSNSKVMGSSKMFFIIMLLKCIVLFWDFCVPNSCCFLFSVLPSSFPTHPGHCSQPPTCLQWH